jgi:hypothetical protein
VVRVGHQVHLFFDVHVTTVQQGHGQVLPICRVPGRRWRVETGGLE